MIAGRKIWSAGWRFGVCALLLLWIFHSIFLQEGQLAWQDQASGWSRLTTSQKWGVAWSSGPRGLWRTLCEVPPTALVLSLILMGATILLGVWRWRMVLRVQGLELRFCRAAEISLIAHFFNSFLLGSTGGDLLKAYYAAHETHHKKTEAVVTVLVDRLIGLFTMLLFATLMMPLNLSSLVAHRRVATVSWLVLLMMLACGVAVVLFFWGGVSKRWPASRHWLRRLPKGDILERSLDASRKFGREPAFLLKALAISMALNVACVLQVAVLAWGLGLSISLKMLLLIVPSIICISALPITPSGLGVRENLFVWLLAVPEISVAATQALSLSLLAYAGSLSWSLLGGIVYISLRDRRHLREVTAVESTDRL